MFSCTFLSLLIRWMQVQVQIFSPPLHNMQIQKPNRNLWLRSPGPTQENCDGSGFGRTWRSLWDGRERWSCDRLKRCYCCSSTISSLSLGERKKTSHSSGKNTRISPHVAYVCLKREGLISQDWTWNFKQLVYLTFTQFSRIIRCSDSLHD